jgi:hypothetical protein
MASVLVSTTVKVTDVQAVKGVLDNYYFNFDPEVEPREGAGAGTLTIAGHDSWPEAVHVDEWADRQEFPDEDAWDDAMRRLLEERGEEGFVAMLGDLAPYLETPLTVVWHRILEGHFDGAGQYTVWPGSPYVQVQTVRPLAAT